MDDFDEEWLAVCVAADDYADEDAETDAARAVVEALFGWPR